MIPMTASSLPPTKRGTDDGGSPYLVRHGPGLGIVEVVRGQDNADILLLHELGELDDVLGRRGNTRFGLDGGGNLEAEEVGEVGPVPVIDDDLLPPERHHLLHPPAEEFDEPLPLEAFFLQEGDQLPQTGQLGEEIPAQHVDEGVAEQAGIDLLLQPLEVLLVQGLAAGIDLDQADGDVLRRLPHAERAAREVRIPLHMDVSQRLGQQFRFFQERHVVGNRHKPGLSAAHLLVLRLVDDGGKPHFHVQALSSGLKKSTRKPTFSPKSIRVCT